VLQRSKTLYLLLNGAQACVQFLIPIGIILYGVNLNFNVLTALSAKVVVFALLGMLIFYLLIYGLNSVVWKLPWKLSELLAAGSAICGASAIAVLSPAVDAEPEETSTSLLVITAMGLLGVMIYPLLKELLGFSDIVYAILSGATLHQTGLVRVAVAPLGKAILDHALAIKTLRILMLAPIAVVTGVLHSRRDIISDRQSRLNIGQEAGATEKPRRGRFQISALLRIWFLLPFLLFGLLASGSPTLAKALTDIKLLDFSLAKIFSIPFSMALGSIGFMVDIDGVLKEGVKPLLAGLFGWLGALLFFILVSPFLP
jgi:uncharacterized membrane protein YadS